MSKKNIELFEKLLHKFFLHFHATLNNNSNIQIDFKDMATSLATSQKVKIKESFGENNNSAFFCLSIEKEKIISETGKSIKTLRKKAYKNLFYYLLDNNIIDNKKAKISEVYEKLEELK